MTQDAQTMLGKIEALYKQFCKETKRSGILMVHSSITAWHQYLAEHLI